MKKILCTLLTVCLLATAFSVFASAHVGVPAVVVYAGDVNEDGTVNLRDLLLLRKAIAEGTESSLPNADVYGDGQIDLKDVLRLRTHLAYCSYPTVKSPTV